MNFRILAEGIEDLLAGAEASVSKSRGAVYDDAMNFFRTGKLSDGTEYPRDIRAKFGFQNPPRIVRQGSVPHSDGTTTYTIRLIFGPGRNGGGGIGLNPVASNMLFNSLGTDGRTLDAVRAAFSDHVRRDQRRINEGLRRWVMKHENAVGLVPELEGKRIADVVLTNIRYKEPRVDPTRRAWPSSRTEIWVPVVADVVITTKEKGDQL